MKFSAFIYQLAQLGISEGQSTATSSRIKIINKFNLLCISYSIPYILFSLSLKFYEPAGVFFTGLLFYLISLNCNRIGQYNIAKFLILIATNFSVFYLSLFYGFASGFHLYYFTSPLIVFSLFDFGEVRKIIFGFFLYLSSITVLVYLNHMGLFINSEMPFKMTELLYSINVFLALSFCLLLVTHFSEFNKKINTKLSSSNNELEEKQRLLEGEIIERKATESKLQTLLKDKEILLSETHHRVKNNLAVVSGMLDLQMLMSDEEKIRDVLSDSRSRIKSMSLIHESLYKYDNVSQIEFGRYIHNLAEEIRKTHSLLPFRINVKYDVEEVYLSVTKAIPCGLLLNEVLTNAYKHAFVGREEGEIVITLKEVDNFCTLVIRDNGIGMNSNHELPAKSIGLTLIEAFVKQLKGAYKFVNDHGTKLILTFER